MLHLGILVFENFLRNLSCSYINIISNDLFFFFLSPNLTRLKILNEHTGNFLLMGVHFLTLQIANFLANSLSRNWPRDLYDKVARSL